MVRKGRKAKRVLQGKLDLQDKLDLQGKLVKMVVME
jgi:hypothetical protein